jgi:hypothetical protein
LSKDSLVSNGRIWTITVTAPKGQILDAHASEAANWRTDLAAATLSVGVLSPATDGRSCGNSIGNFAIQDLLLGGSTASVFCPTCPIRQAIPRDIPATLRQSELPAHERRDQRHRPASLFFGAPFC